MIDSQGIPLAFSTSPHSLQRQFLSGAYGQVNFPRDEQCAWQELEKALDNVTDTIEVLLGEFTLFYMRTYVTR